MENNRIHLDMNFEDFVTIFGGENIRLVRRLTHEEEMESEVTGLIDDHFNNDAIIRQIKWYLSLEENKDMNAYFMGVKDIVGGGYWMHPNYSAYGICLARNEEEAKIEFTFDQNGAYKQRGYSPEVVVLSKIHISEEDNNGK